MSGWSEQELERVGQATELQVSSRRATISGRGRIRAGGIERDVVFEVRTARFTARSTRPTTRSTTGTAHGSSAASSDTPPRPAPYASP
ncbi:hypothetical protein [Kribbella sp. C-35]|uniref:hypothetical protein n=1 Tax=Kribbella sp. C-35 TaxID=2789276 RepID=UPI00397C010B